ncbi:glycosyl hydrolase family 92-domain-containing protein [Mycena galopus ATCC 62051]|nr:glycosyl hydrolase family 92-domain-containing protein [Mycena galopus ATCC 62051]
MEVDWHVGLEAMLTDATVMGDFEVEARGGINSREKLGHVPVGDKDHPPSPGSNTRSASRLLEYAYNDFDIALVALGLGHTTLAAHYFNKSHDWFNLWNLDAEHSGFKGFIQPRNADGSWFLGPHDTNGAFRPDHCSPVYGHNDCFGGWGGGEFYEASSWEYSFYIPHDMARLVEAMGGKETFSARLDRFFEAGFHDMGDEPGFLPTYLYNYVGQPTKNVDRVDAMVSQYYTNAVDGLPGHDDSGSMGAYVVWSYLGFYPVAGQSTYLLNRPYFPKTTIRNPVSGTVAIILATNLSAENRYAQSAKLDGEAYTKNSISHDLFLYGGTLELVMGAGKDSKWGTGDEDLLPNLSTGGWGVRRGRGAGALRKKKKTGEAAQKEQEERLVRAVGRARGRRMVKAFTKRLILRTAASAPALRRRTDFGRIYCFCCLRIKYNGINILSIRTYFRPNYVKPRVSPVSERKKRSTSLEVQFQPPSRRARLRKIQPTEAKKQETSQTQ